MCLLSIIIPTHNRSAYAAQMIQALYQADDTQISIQKSSAHLQEQGLRQRLQDDLEAL